MVENGLLLSAERQAPQMPVSTRPLPRHQLPVASAAAPRYPLSLAASRALPSPALNGQRPHAWVVSITKSSQPTKMSGHSSTK